MHVALVRVKVFISMYEPLEVTKCEKCNNVVAQSWI